MASRKTTAKPVTPIIKDEVVKENVPSMEEPKQEQEQAVLRFNPLLWKKMMKIGDQAYWQRVVENFTNNLSGIYRN